MKKSLLMIAVLFFLNYLGIYANNLILSEPTATKEQAKTWAFAKESADHFIELIDLYWEICAQYGVNPVIAYCQAAKETGYGKFGGLVKVHFFNPCGMKITHPKEPATSEDHQKFSCWEDGVRAHVEHLALYAGAPGFPLQKNEVQDPRHFSWIHGTAETVEQLGGKWAPSVSYGNEIVKLVKELESK